MAHPTALLTRVINGVECEFLHASEATRRTGAMLHSIRMCLGCPFANAGGECSYTLPDDDTTESLHCVDVASELRDRGRLDRRAITADYYWFSPIIYELNKE